MFALVAAFAMALALTSTPVQADSLHGFCTTASDCVGTSVNGNPVIQFTGTAQFGFYDAGGPVTGTDAIVILSPTNVGGSIPLVGGGALSGTGSLDLLSGEWTGGFLDSFLGISANPANPFSNYGGPSGIDSSASGFFVYAGADAGITLNDQAGELSNPLFTVPGGLPAGDFALGFFLPNGADKWIGTPNSEALESTGTTAPVPTPEPSSLSMLGIGLLGMVAFARRRMLA